MEPEAEGLPCGACVDREYLVTVRVVVGSPRRLQLASAERQGEPVRFFEVVHVQFYVDLLLLSTFRPGRRRDRWLGLRPRQRRGRPATVRDYYETVIRAVGVTPIWDDAQAWTGRLLAHRARGWGWTPAVGVAKALDEVAQGLLDGGHPSAG